MIEESNISIVGQVTTFKSRRESPSSLTLGKCIGYPSFNTGNPIIMEVTAIGWDVFTYVQDGRDYESIADKWQFQRFSPMPEGRDLEIFSYLRGFHDVGTSLLFLEDLKKGRIPHVSIEKE